MRKLTMSLDHDLTLPEARRRVQILLQKVQDTGGSWTQRWSSKTRLHFIVELTGGTITGEVVIQQRKIAVTINLPWTLQLFTSRIQRSIEQSAQQALNGS